MTPPILTPRLLALTLLVATGCEREPEVDLPPLTLHGTYISMGIEGEALPCAGTIPWMDRHVETLGELFERDVSDVWIGYYWLRNESMIHCALGCTISATEVHAIDPLIEHEIAHAVTEHWVGRGEWFFSEGLAVATSDQLYGVGSPKHLDQIHDMIGAGRTAELEYLAAGMFVTYLIEGWGAPLFLEFYGTTRGDDDYGAVATKFEQTYDMALSTALANFTALVEDQGACVMILPACTVEPLPWTGEKWEVDVGVACDDNALGPDSGPHILDRNSYRFVTVDIPEAGNYLLTNDGPPIDFHHCGPCSERGPSHISSMFSEPGTLAKLSAGRYVAHLPGQKGWDVVHHLTIEPAP